MHYSQHQLYWLPAQPLSISQLVQEGFNWVDCAAGWGEPNRSFFGWECTSFKEYCNLLPVSADQWLPVASPEHFPTPMYQDFWDHPAPANFFTNVNDLELDRTGLADWYRTIFLEFDSDVCTELRDALFESHLLVRLGYKVARKAAQKLGVTSVPFQAAMSAVGAGCSGIELWVCSHCFRRSRGELRLCDLHSQAKVVLDLADTDRNIQYQRTRTARKVLRTLKTIQKRQFNGYWGLDLYEFELQVGGILWPLTGAAHNDWLASVLQALSQAPLVREKLTKSTFRTEPYHEQLEQLQKAVGSREWLAARWPEVIPLAEKWLQAEKKIAPGATEPGLNEHNLKRFAVAQELLAKNVRHSQIAEQLGISRSHLSQLLRRGARRMQK